MKYVYPAIFTKEYDKNGGENGFSVLFPDIPGCITQGDNLAEAIEAAEDALALVMYDMEEKGLKAPSPSECDCIKPAPGEILSCVRCDTIAYRRFYDSKAVKKTLTIPAWLNTMAEKSDINFSQTLQDALKRQLRI